MICKIKQVARSWAYDGPGESWNGRIADACDNLTRAYQRRYPGSFVTWEYSFGKNGNIAFYLWNRMEATP